MKCMQQEKRALFVGSQPPEWGCPILGRANLSKQWGPGEVKTVCPVEHWSNYLWYTNSTTWVEKNLAICGGILHMFTYFCRSIRSTFAGTPWGFGWGWGVWRSVQCLAVSVVWIVAFGCIHLNFCQVQLKKAGYTTQMWSCIRSCCCIIYVHSSCHMYDYDIMYTVTYLSCVFCLLSSWITHHVCMIQQRSYLINHTYNTKHAVFWMRLCTVCDIAWCTIWKRSSRWTFLYSSISKSIVSANSLPNPRNNRYVATYIVQALKDA